MPKFLNIIFIFLVSLITNISIAQENTNKKEPY